MRLHFIAGLAVLGLTGCYDVARHAPLAPRAAEILVVETTRPPGASQVAPEIVEVVAGEQARRVERPSAGGVAVEVSRPSTGARANVPATTVPLDPPPAHAPRVLPSRRGDTAPARIAAESATRQRVAAGSTAPHAVPAEPARAPANAASAVLATASHGADDPRCAEGFLPEVDLASPATTLAPATTSLEAQRALARLEAGCGLEGIAPTSELLRATTGSGLPLPERSGPLAGLDRRVVERSRALSAARTETAVATAPGTTTTPAPLPPGDTTRPTTYNGVRDAISGARR